MQTVYLITEKGLLLLSPCFLFYSSSSCSLLPVRLQQKGNSTNKKIHIKCRTDCVLCWKIKLSLEKQSPECVNLKSILELILHNVDIQLKTFVLLSVYCWLLSFFVAFVPEPGTRKGHDKLRLVKIRLFVTSSGMREIWGGRIGMVRSVAESVRTWSATGRG